MLVDLKTGFMMLKSRFSRLCSHSLEERYMNKISVIEIRIWLTLTISNEVVKIISKSTCCIIYLLSIFCVPCTEPVVHAFLADLTIWTLPISNVVLTSFLQATRKIDHFTSFILSDQGLSHFIKGVLCVGPVPANSCKVPDWSRWVKVGLNLASQKSVPGDFWGPSSIPRAG